MKLYAFVQFETNEVSRYGNILDIGYVTESILASDDNKFRNKRVKVMCCGGYVCYPKRKQITTIIPHYCILK